MINKFGIMLRAGRLGYHLSERHWAYIRISELRYGVWRVDVCPRGDLMPSDIVKEYVCWWEGDPYILSNCQPLRKFEDDGPTEFQTFIVNDDGEEISVKDSSKKRDKNLRSIQLKLDCGHEVYVPTTFHRLYPERIDTLNDHYSEKGVWCQECESLRSPIEYLGSCKTEDVDVDE